MVFEKRAQKSGFPTSSDQGSEKCSQFVARGLSARISLPRTAPRTAGKAVGLRPWIVAFIFWTMRPLPTEQSDPFSDVGSPAETEQLRVEPANGTQTIPVAE